MRVIAKALKISFIVCAFGLMTSCGSSNNDQGTTVTFAGFLPDCDNYQPGANNPGLTGLSVPISLFFADEPQLFGGGGLSIIGLEVINNLAAAGFRADTIRISYEIPGASNQPPSTASPIGIILGPAADSNTGATSSLPPGFANAEVSSCAEFVLIPFPVLEWLNLNRNNIPEAPFQLFATVSVSGVTTSGDRIDTNPLTIFVDVETDNPIPPTAGSEGQTGGLESGTESNSASDDVFEESEAAPSDTTDDTLAQEEDDDSSEEQVV